MKGHVGRVCPRRPIEPEQRVLARARWSISLRIALVMAAVLVLIGLVVFVVMLASQHADATRDLTYVAARSDVHSPPGCAWLVVDHDGVVAVSPETPAGFPLTSSLNAVRGGAAPFQQAVSANGTSYQVLTTWRGRDVVQAVFDKRFQIQDRASLVRAILVAELCGTVAAAVLGGLLARRAMAPLVEALCRQRRFVADASHELRTPLTRLHTRAQLLVRRADALALPAKLRADLQKLVTGSRQLGDVIDELLMSTRLQTGQDHVDTVDLAAVADEVRVAEEARTQVAQVELVVRRAPGPYAVTGVGAALRRVVSALVDNAIGHTPPGGRIEVEVGGVAAAGPGGAVRLSVRDTGVGFAPEDAERLFERFARGESGRGRRFGIGLALVREVVESHDGTITAEGSPGAGARFTVVLPARPMVPVPVPRDPAAGAGTTRNAAGVGAD